MIWDIQRKLKLIASGGGRGMGIDWIEATATEAYAEIERLRAALQKIADLIDSEAGEPLDDAIEIASTALNQQSAPDPLNLDTGTRKSTFR